MMMTRRHRDDRHLVRLALDDVFPGGVMIMRVSDHGF